MLGRQSLDQSLLRGLLSRRILGVRTVWRASIDVTDKTVSELEVLVAFKEKADQHPRERSVSTHLTNDSI